MGRNWQSLYMDNPMYKSPHHVLPSGLETTTSMANPIGLARYLVVKVPAQGNSTSV